MDTRFGKFVLVEKIAEGGMGEVFLAHQRGLGQFERYVVLKRLRADLVRDSELEAMFLQEARISARLSHPNVVQVYEFGRVDDRYFLTLEHVRGADLSMLQRELALLGRPWPLEVVFEVMIQVCTGLSYVHSLEDYDGRPLNIVHRDVSPSNVMVSREGMVKLLDFGIAHVRGTLVQAHGLQGKLAYLSPEQCNSEPLDGRSDLFSLGVVLWEMLTGERLFRRATDEETLFTLLRSMVRRPSSIRPDLPARLDELVLQMLARDRRERCAGAEDVLSVLHELVRELALSGGPRVLARFLASVDNLDHDRPFPRVPVEVSLPRSARSATAVRPPRNVLVVDDDQETLNLMRAALRGRYHVLACHDPLDALKIIEDNPIDVLITDQQMPGLTGLELIRLAVQMRPKLLKVLCSGLCDAAVLIEAINTNHIDRFISKPWTPDALGQSVDDLFGEQLLPADMVQSEVQNQTAELDQELGGLDERRVDFSMASLERFTPTEKTRGGPSRRPLRPQVLRAMAQANRISLVVLGYGPKQAERSLQVWAQSRLSLGDQIVQVEDDKLALILLEAHPGPVKAMLQLWGPQLLADDGVLGPTGHFDFGVACLPDDTADVDELIMQADMARFHSRSGRKLHPR
jgi:serine/threonine-protein kinase